MTLNHKSLQRQKRHREDNEIILAFYQLTLLQVKLMILYLERSKENGIRKKKEKGER